jgi:penicillin-binding protein 1C
LPKPELIRQQSYSKAFYDSDNKLLRLTLASDQRYRLWLPLEEISPSVIEATILYEDKYFYHHPGVNFFALVRGFIDTYIKQSRVVGASTITMQVARLHFGINSRTITGKITQILRAFQLEWHYSKT